MQRRLLSVPDQFQGLLLHSGAGLLHTVEYEGGLPVAAGILKFVGQVHQRNRDDDDSGDPQHRDNDADKDSYLGRGILETRGLGLLKRNDADDEAGDADQEGQDQADDASRSPGATSSTNSS